MSSDYSSQIDSSLQRKKLPEIPGFVIMEHCHNGEEKGIGEGAFGSIYLAIEQSTKKIFAVKVIADPENTQMEFSLLKLCNYPTVIKPYKIFEKDPCAIVLDFYPNGSLQSYIKEDTVLTFTDKYVIATGIALGIRYLHRLKIAHRDLKPDNVLLDSSFFPKLCDFGQSKKNQSLSNQNSSVVGTLGYVPPEIIYQEGKYDSYKVDSYEYGMTIATLFFGQYINRSLFEDLLPHFNLPEHIKEIIIQCVDSKQPSKRLSFEEIVTKLLDRNNIQSMKVLFPDFEEKKLLSLLYLCNEVDNYTQTIKEDQKEKFSNIKKLSESSYKLGNIQESLEYQFQAFNLGMSDAKYDIAEFFSKKELQDTFPKIIDHYKSLLNENNKNIEELKKAYYILGYIHENGFGTQQNFSSAFEFFKIGAELGDGASLNRLGVLSEYGHGVPQSYQEAKNYYEASAITGNSDGLLNLAKFYGKNKLQLMTSLANQSIEKGNTDAYIFLGDMSKDYITKLNYYNQALEMGSSTALISIGALCEEISTKKVISPDFLAKIKSLLNSIFKDDTHNPEITTAKELYQLAAKQNNSEGLNYIGKLYENGKLPERNNIELAERYYKKAVVKFNNNAIFNIGYLYDTFKNNQKEAIKYYRLTELRGNPTHVGDLIQKYLENIPNQKDQSAKVKYLIDSGININVRDFHDLKRIFQFLIIMF